MVRNAIICDRSKTPRRDADTLVEAIVKPTLQITNYATKPLEQLQNLVTQYAVGLRRLEVEEAEALAQATARGQDLQPDLQRRARRVLLKLHSSANRCHWFSCTELATFLKTGDTCWASHSVRPLFLSRHTFMLHECQRLLEKRTPGILEAPPVALNTVEFAPAPPAPHTAAAAARSNSAPQDKACSQQGDNDADDEDEDADADADADDD